MPGIHAERRSGHDARSGAVSNGVGGDRLLVRSRSVLETALTENGPSPEVVFLSIADSLDLVERVRFATRFTLEGMAERQGAVRTMIAATISQPDLNRDARPGIRFTFIDQALDPLCRSTQQGRPGWLRRVAPSTKRRLESRG